MARIGVTICKPRAQGCTSSPLQRSTADDPSPLVYVEIRGFTGAHFGGVDVLIECLLDFFLA
eukprot:m.296995 g.296995  ORF g.296995 m.296995 type:complete len:62 (+) comp16283_c1_seq18:904-1089(+)